MGERFRPIPAGSVKEFIAQNAKDRRRASRNFIAHWQNVTPLTETPHALPEKENILSQIRELDSNKRCSSTTALYNRERLLKHVSEYGADSIRTLLPTDSPSYARIMNLVQRRKINTKQDLLGANLTDLASQDRFGTKSIAIIGAMQKLARIDLTPPKPGKPRPPRKDNTLLH